MSGSTRGVCSTRAISQTSPSITGAFEAMLAAFDGAFRRFAASPAMHFLQSPRFDRRHCAAALREFYFYTRDNPQLQASMTLRFRGRQRSAVKRMLAHAISEVGHDQLALDDLKCLGVDTSGIEDQDPMPSTVPMIAFPVWQLSLDNPVGYLGHIFFLEFMPTRGGAGYLRRLMEVGIPQEACTFLSEHSEVDVQHNNLMKQHVADLVLSEEDLKACLKAIDITSHLYAHMLEGAFASVAE